MQININDEFIKTLFDLNIFTTWSYSDAINGISWLNNFNALLLDSEIKIEGPSAFYGGEFPNQKWECNGGLCTIGAYSYSHSFTPAGLTIGRYSSIAKGLRILDFSHPTLWLSSSVAFFTPKPLVSKSALAEFCDLKNNDSDMNFVRTEFDPKNGKSYPFIGHDVWIAENVSLAMGINIGHGAIIAANSTVTKDVPPYAVVAGNPATVKKYRFSKELIARLIDSEWWDYDVTDFENLNYTKPLDFLDKFELRKNSLNKLNPHGLKINSKGIINVF